MYYRTKDPDDYTPNTCSDERDQIDQRIYEIEEDLIEFLLLYFVQKRIHLIIQKDIEDADATFGDDIQQ